MGRNGLSPPRCAGRYSPGLGLPREESRGALEDVALLLQALDALAQLTQLLTLDARQPVIALTAIALVLTLPVPQATARTSPGTRRRPGSSDPDEPTRAPHAGTAPGTAASISAFQSILPATLAPQVLRTPQNRGNSRRARRLRSSPTLGGYPRSQPPPSKISTWPERMPDTVSSTSSQAGPSSRCCGPPRNRSLPTRDRRATVHLAEHRQDPQPGALPQLGVTSRGDAVARADALGLLDPTESPG